MMLRSDIDTILDWVTQGSRVLDLGCGDGELLAALTKQKACLLYTSDAADK